MPVISEQMDSYINHELDSIIEEHSKIMKFASANKFANTIDLATEKSRLIGSKTTYTDNNQQKESPSVEMNTTSALLRSNDRASTLLNTQIAQSEKEKK